jgi:uncharacterized membrane protein YphA (DoxX/SURF4 family)
MVLEVSSPLAAEGAAPSGRLAQVAGAAGAAFLGLVLLVAAAAKALDPLAFAQQIHQQGLAFALSAPTWAVLAIALEVALGALLLLGVRRLWVLIPATLLVAFFVFLTGRDAWRAAHGTLPEDAACGCFGNLVERTPAQAFWQDLLLLVPALGLAFVGRPREARFPGARLAAAAVATLAAVGFAIRAPSLPLDDFATRLRPGARTAALCAGSGAERVCLEGLVPEVAEGRHLVVIADLSSEAFGAAVRELNDYAARAGSSDPALWVLAAPTPEEKHAFFWKYGPTFELREAPPALLRPLYRRLPRSFAVEDGKVTRTWSGLPPLASQPAQLAARVPGAA